MRNSNGNDRLLAGWVGFQSAPEDPDVKLPSIGNRAGL